MYFIAFSNVLLFVVKYIISLSQKYNQGKFTPSIYKIAYEHFSFKWQECVSNIDSYKSNQQYTNETSNMKMEDML